MRKSASLVLALYDDDSNALCGDISDQVGLWDAGADEMVVAQLIADSGDGYTYPPVPATLRVTLAVDNME